MLDWNVVVTVHGDAFTRACQIFSQFGEVRRSGYYNIFLLRVSDQGAFLERLSELFNNVPALKDMVSRVMPAEATFTFHDHESFESQACAVARAWIPELAGKSFHVRMHRRGMHEQMSSRDEERFLDEYILHELAEQGTPGRITFDDPDAIIDVETLNERAGLSLWTREQLALYPFLKLD